MGPWRLEPWAAFSGHSSRPVRMLRQGDHSLETGRGSSEAASSGWPAALTTPGGSGCQGATGDPLSGPSLPVCGGTPQVLFLSVAGAGPAPSAAPLTPPRVGRVGEVPSNESRSDGRDPRSHLLASWPSETGCRRSGPYPPGPCHARTWVHVVDRCRLLSWVTFSASLRARC